jgi:H+/Cl- antiporter ClcA
LPFWLGAFITGIVAVLFARLFILAETGTRYIFNLNKYLFFAITPACFCTAWWLVKKFAPYSRGSGIPQVSAAVELATPADNHKTDKLLSIRVIIIKILSTIVMAFGGGAIGREGPTIQIAGSIFKKINDWLPEWYPKISKKNMLVTGAAAGLAAAFNTPLGGIVFAIEELTKTHFSYFKSALLTGVIIAGFTALNIIGPYLYLGYPKVDGTDLWALIPILIVAVITGICGSGMGKLLMYIFRKKRGLKSNFSKFGYVAACGLIMATLAVFVNSQSFGSGKEIIQTTLFTANKHVDLYIPALRFITPVISFSTGGSGGIFAPALSAGAATGAVISGWFHLAAANTNLVVLCGMAGFLTGVTRSPFTCSILVLEMTDANNIIFYLMIASLIANIVAALVDKHSFYDRLKVQYIHDINHELTPAAESSGDNKVEESPEIT